MLPVEAGLPPVEAALSMLARAAHDADPTQGRARASLVTEAAMLLRSVAAALGADLAGNASVAEGFARAWHCDRRAGEAIRAALVLTADHELNASTFAARVTASTGAPLAAAALSGLATLLGPVHGGASLRARALVDDAEPRRRQSRRAALAAARRSAAGFRPSALPRHRSARSRRCSSGSPCRMSPPIW